MEARSVGWTMIRRGTEWAGSIRGTTRPSRKQSPLLLLLLPPILLSHLPSILFSGILAWKMEMQVEAVIILPKEINDFLLLITLTKYLAYLVTKHSSRLPLSPYIPLPLCTQLYLRLGFRSLLLFLCLPLPLPLPLSLFLSLPPSLTHRSLLARNHWIISVFIG